MSQTRSFLRKFLSWSMAALILPALLLLLLPLYRPATPAGYTASLRTTELPELTPHPAAFLFNGGSLAELSKLPGIGETLASRIIESRELDGPFCFPEDIMHVSGVGEKRYADIMDYLALLEAETEEPPQ